MNDIRPYASLSGSLLARKGGAKPAMRPRPLTTGGMLDDLGWDDMGDSAAEGTGEHVPSSIAGLTPAPKASTVRDEPAPVHVQQRVLAETFAQVEPAEQRNLSQEVVSALRAPSAERPAPPKQQAPKQQARISGKKAAFTLRLDPERHLRLRVAAAVSAQSAQQLVTAALDQYLQSFPELSSLAQQLPSHASKRS